MFWFFEFYYWFRPLPQKNQSNKCSNKKTASFKCTDNWMFVVVMGIIFVLCVIAQLAAWALQ